MFDIKCKTDDSITLTTLRQFQGDLKKRTDADIAALIDSITKDGLLMPFAVWYHDNQASILDGHARYEAMVRMAIDDPSILTVPLPVIVIDAEDDAEARKALLQITSSYGRITKKGLIQFTASMPVLPSAPIIAKVMAPIKVAKPKEPDYAILRVKVKKELVGQMIELLGKVDGVSIL
jgi:hypothetical protein